MGWDELVGPCRRRYQERVGRLRESSFDGGKRPLRRWRLRRCGRRPGRFTRKMERCRMAGCWGRRCRLPRISIVYQCPRDFRERSLCRRCLHTSRRNQREPNRTLGRPELVRHGKRNGQRRLHHCRCEARGIHRRQFYARWRAEHPKFGAVGGRAVVAGRKWNHRRLDYRVRSRHQ